MGAASVGVSLTSSSAFAGDSSPFCPDCPDGTSALAKYEWNESTGQFELDFGCDVVTFTDVTLDSDDEPVDVTWESSILYTGHNVKYSTACDSFTRDETRVDDDTKDGVYVGNVTKDDLNECKAISYISFCATPCFQVDFVFGPSIENLGNDDGGFYKARKIVHLWGNTLTGEVTGTAGVTETRDGCTVSTDGVVADLDTGTATVDFTHSDDACELTLVSYVAPCPVGFTEPTGDQQSRFDYVTETVSGDGTFTVDLPTAADLDALCDEFGGSVV